MDTEPNPLKWILGISGMLFWTMFMIAYPVHVLKNGGDTFLVYVWVIIGIGLPICVAITVILKRYRRFQYEHV